MPFIEHLPTVQSFSNQGVALFVPLGCILGTARHYISREIRVHTVQDFQGLPKAFTLKRQHHQDVHVGVRSRLPVGVETKKDDSFRLELACNSFAQASDFFSSIIGFFPMIQQLAHSGTATVLYYNERIC